MELAKKEIVENFLNGCLELGMTLDESVDLAARNLIGAVQASGQTYIKIEIEQSGIVEVEC
ncbi:hypothetical protein AB6D11_06370 [Vibrio splendidus]